METSLARRDRRRQCRLEFINLSVRCLQQHLQALSESLKGHRIVLDKAKERLAFIQDEYRIARQEWRRRQGLIDPKPLEKGFFVRYKLSTILQAGVSLKRCDWTLLNSRLQPMIDPVFLVKYRGAPIAELRRSLGPDIHRQHGLLKTSSVPLVIELIRCGGRLDSVHCAYKSKRHSAITKFNLIWIAYARRTG